MTKISVIMPNYNTPLVYLEKAVESILQQTYDNFEFIIVDDCSTDESYEYLCSLTDKRIKLVRNEENRGVTASLNLALSLATGDFIARMDSDDISLPNRLERQLQFMKEHENVIVCGTWAREIGDKSGLRGRHLPNQKEYQCGVLFGNINHLVHPTVLFRTSMLRHNNIWYDDNIRMAQDYAMWATCARYGEVANVEEILFQYRVHNGQISTAKRDQQIQCAIYTIKNQLQNIFPDITDAEVQQHYRFCKALFITAEMQQWFSKIVEENNKVEYVDKEALLKVKEEFLQRKATEAATVVSSLKDIIALLRVCDNKCRKIVLRKLMSRIKQKCFSSKQ